jgi:leader peptidase (prepilin peptidase)/N-methyltransferase
LAQSNLIILFVFLFGVSFGSFMNVLIYRIPKGMSVITPPSACPNCDNKLQWYHNIPLFSWLFLKGKCHYCKTPISALYPFVELLTGVLWVAIYIKMGLSWYLPFTLLSFSMLFALSMIDIKYYAVPDSLNFLALGFAFVGEDFTSRLIDASLAAFGLWLLGFIVSKLAKKESLGSADIIVAATMAALLGFPAFFIAMFLAALLAIVPSLMAKDTMVPFVPFLALATLITFLFKEILIQYLEATIYA